MHVSHSNAYTLLIVGSLAVILSRVSSGFDQYVGTEVAAQGIA